MTEPTLNDPVGCLPDSSPIDAIFAAVIQAAEFGVPATPDELYTRFPEHREQLEQFLVNYQWMRGGKAPTARPTRRIRAGESFGNYQLVAELAAGGMGVVYRARQTGLDRDVALKVIRAAFADADDLRRFDLEARATAQLAHPHIVPIHDVGEVDGIPYYSMELMEGGNLGDAGLDLRASVAVMAKVARAIQHAHDHAILHRDLKPANILLDDDGEPRVTDFGLACRIDDSQRETRSGALLGTVFYMSPEQASGVAKQLTVGTDIWALGAVLYHCLTGTPPFAGATVVESIEKVIKDEPAPPSRANPEVDADLQAICLHCLEKKPERRYHSAQALADDLEAWAEGRPVVARPIPRWDRAWRWCRRRPLRALLAALVALLPGLVIIAAVAQLGDLEGQLAEATARQDEILDSNVYAANLAAGAVKQRFGQLGNLVTDVQRDPGRRTILLGGDTPRKEAVLDRLRERLAHSGVASVFVVESDGKIRARSPRSERDLDKSFFGDRDYVLGARSSFSEGKPFVHESKIYRGVADHKFKFGLSIALSDAENSPVLVASFSASNSIGVAELSDGRRRGTLVCAYDPRADALEKPSHWIVLHDGYEPVEKRPVASTNERCHSSGRIANYRDPLAERKPELFGGNWLVGVAEIGGTEFTVLVQRQYDGVGRAEARLSYASKIWRMVLLLGVLSAAIAGLMVLPSRN